MIAEVHGREDQSHHHGQEYPEEATNKLPGVKEDEEDNGRVTAREGILLEPLEEIQGIPDGVRREDPVKVHRLEMSQCEPGPDRRKQEVAQVGEVKSESHAEDRPVKAHFFPPPIQSNHQDDRKKVICGVGPGEDFGEPGVDKPVEPDGGMSAKEGKIQLNKDGVPQNRAYPRQEIGKAVEQDRYEDNGVKGMQSSREPESPLIHPPEQRKDKGQSTVFQQKGRAMGRLGHQRGEHKGKKRQIADQIHRLQPLMPLHAHSSSGYEPPS